MRRIPAGDGGTPGGRVYRGVGGPAGLGLAVVPESATARLAVEFPAADGPREGVPFRRIEFQADQGGVLAVADSDLAARQGRDLYAVAVVGAVGALPPGNRWSGGEMPPALNGKRHQEGIVSTFVVHSRQR